MGYDADPNGNPFLFRGEGDDRLPNFERVTGIVVDGEPVAVPFTLLGDDRVAYPFTGDNADVVVLHKPGLRSPVDAAEIAESRDVGQSGVFRSTVDGQALTFSADADGNFTDEETGSTWNVVGNAIAGELEGQKLEPIPAVDGFWFAWSAYRPNTEVFEA